MGVVYKGERRLVTDRKAVEVAEVLGDGPSRPEASGVIVAENGKILMQGKVLGDILVAGQPACVELLVKNHSSKKVITPPGYCNITHIFHIQNTGLTVTLSRDLRLAGLAPNEKPPLQLSDILTSVSFRGPEFIIYPGVEGVANLVFDVPPHAKSLRGGPRNGGEDQRIHEHIFEVKCTVNICLALGFGR